MDTNLISSKMQKVVDSVVSDISAIRSGRATPSLIENVICPAYGGTQPLRVLELASITAPDTQTLVISPWDKSIIGDIRKGILEANIGMNPSIDGEVIRIVFPQLTTEDREKYVKLLSQKLENGKVMIRQIRADEMHDIKKGFEAKEITEDEKKDTEKKLQELTDLYIGKIETLGETKKKELLTI
ncbi:MAG: ribosome recycling factor [Patescibacteria group bacterium]